MLRGDVSILSKMSGLSKSTIRRRAEKAGIDISPFMDCRCDKTVDVFTGDTLNDEHEKWIKKSLTAILSVPDGRKKSYE